MKNIKSLSISELRRYFESTGEKKYRANQLFKWLWGKGVESFHEMTDIKKEVREKLSEEFYIFRLKIIKILKSRDGTKKYLFLTEDGNLIESVFIPDGRRRTVCVSSQIGCALGCRFCETGKDGLIRDLMFYEISQQVLEIMKNTGERITNVVFMGMGEPLLNMDNVLSAIEILNSPMGMAIGKRRITISTAGVVPGIYSLMERGIKQIKLAVSLNSPFDEIRDNLMPINKKYPIKTLIKSIKDFVKFTGKRVTIEYVLIHGITDRREDAEELIRILRGIPLKINLIPYNPGGDGGFIPPSRKDVERFANHLFPHLPAVNIRRSRGQDIKGACGQLRASHIKNNG